MPTYEYKCKECERSFEVFQSMKDEPLSACPECGGSVRRILSGGAGVIFKGQGFYVTDKGKSAAKGAPGDSKPDVPAKKEATATASSNADSAATPSCPAASGGSRAARTDNVS
ncbi:MAG: zinc ribbon domain-containing protein [Spirochaetaceae bacterium]|jgi:putative FmdB family regulatory protein|nr:zinc ribbon domain-containing protein [Spirochaetaceae bacterium]